MIDLDIIRLRSEVNKQIRGFFDGRNFLEVDTPLLSPDLIPESSISWFSTELKSGIGAPGREMYLIPSPEIWMKKLLSAGTGSCYQICKCFRNREQSGRIHNPEFTMLEWYETGADYMDSIKTTEELFRRFVPLGAPANWKKPFARISMEEAFFSITGEDIAPWCRTDGEGISYLTESMIKLGHNPEAGISWEEGFNLMFVHHVEPNLPSPGPVVLYDYPARIPTTAAGKPGTPWSQRWELYIEGVELANCFTEETEPEGIKKYFESEIETISQRENPPAADPDYHRFFHKDYPKVSGTAMGIDRLIMLLAGRKNLRGVILFPFSDIIS